MTHVLGRLRGDYSGWDIGRSDGLWTANRRRVLTNGEMSAGLRHSVVGGTAEELRDALAAQEALAEQQAETDASRGLL